MAELKTFDTELDWTGTPWYKKEFLHPDRTIRIATSFSGIGSAEWALKKLGLKHKIVFACDNGERYLKFGYKKLAEFAKGLDEEQKKQYVENLSKTNLSMCLGLLCNKLAALAKKLDADEKTSVEDILEYSKTEGNPEVCLENIYVKLEEFAKDLDDDKKLMVDDIVKNSKSQSINLTFGSIYSNLFVECKSKGKIELAKECIDILTDGMSKAEVVDYVNWLYEQTGKKNNVKESYMANYDLDEKDYHNDIRFLDGDPYKDQVDLFVFGSPCQSYSQSGKRLGLKDTRGTLFGDAAKIIDQIHPKTFIFENVEGMLTHDKGNTWKVIRNVFEDLGYDIHWRIVDASDYGSVQARERLICIGFKNKADFKFPRPFKSQHKIMDIMDDKVPGVRMPTPKECLRYMGFDDSFKQVVANTTLKHQCGNSIVVNVFEALYRQMDITQYGE